MKIVYPSESLGTIITLPVIATTTVFVYVPVLQAWSREVVNNIFAVRGDTTLQKYCCEYRFTSPKSQLFCDKKLSHFIK